MKQRVGALAAKRMTDESQIVREAVVEFLDKHAPVAAPITPASSILNSHPAAAPAVPSANQEQEAATAN